MNHIFYADDVILLSPSAFGLQVLLNVCEKFATDHDIVYNTKKTVCMLIRPKMLKTLKTPEVSLCGTTLRVVDDYKYLGYLM